MFAPVPLNPSGLVVPAPAADPPPEPALGLVALKTLRQYLRSPLSGSKSASTSETHSSPAPSPYLLTSPRSTFDQFIVETAVFSVTISRLQHILLAFVVFIGSR